jgi:hypothetical protein
VRAAMSAIRRICFIERRLGFTARRRRATSPPPERECELAHRGVGSDRAGVPLVEPPSAHHHGRARHRTREITAQRA